MARKRLTAYLALSLPVAFLLVGGCIDLLSLTQPAVTYPDLVIDTESAAEIPVKCIFPFQDGEYSLEIVVDDALYQGAKQSDKNAVLHTELEDEEWLPGYYRAFTEDDDLEVLYDALLIALQDIRDLRQLDDDEYLELITVFVQSIPYRTDDRTTEPKFPVETIVEKKGDCDDKSLLLAGLLSREGYDAALLYFDEENHMAVGIRCPGYEFRSTDYAIIETTNVTLVGIAPQRLEGGIALESDPLVIPVGEGGRAYASCDETFWLDEQAQAAQRRADELKPVLDQLIIDLTGQQSELDKLESELNALKRKGNYAAYNSRISQYNSLIADYNADMALYNEKLAEYNRYADLYNYIITHQYDRKGTFLWLQQQ